MSDVLVFHRRHLANSVHSRVFVLILIFLKRWEKMVFIVKSYLLILGVMLMIFFHISVAVDACPKCFGTSSQQVFLTYYFSALFLSAIPFGIIVSSLIWLRLHKRRISHSKTLNNSSGKTSTE